MAEQTQEQSGPRINRAVRLEDGTTFVPGQEDKLQAWFDRQEDNTALDRLSKRGYIEGFSVTEVQREEQDITRAAATGQLRREQQEVERTGQPGRRVVRTLLPGTETNPGNIPPITDPVRRAEDADADEDDVEDEDDVGGDTK